MNEEKLEQSSEDKLNPMLSYDKEQGKPKLLNNDAVYLCIEFLANPEKPLDSNCHFNVDDSFLDYMAECQQAAGVGVSDLLLRQPSQEEIDKFVLNMIQECGKVEEDNYEPFDKIMRQKLDINDHPADKKSDKDKKTDIPWYDGDL